MGLMVAAQKNTIAPMPMGQTAQPNINIVMPEDCSSCCVTIENSDEDPDATIYFAYSDGNSIPFEWMIYDGSPVTITQPGDYTIMAYAQSEGKEASEVTEAYFTVLQIQTAVPSIDYVQVDESEPVIVTLTNYDEDPGARIYYAYYYEDGGGEDWTLYEGTPVELYTPGYYTFMAYAISDGKAPSEVVSAYIYVAYRPKRASAPLIHPLDNYQINGLELGIGTDPVYNEYIVGYNPDPYTYVYADTYSYRINDGEWLSTGPQGGTITLPGYGHYTIKAYGYTDGAELSPMVTAIVDYDATGYTTLFDNIIVHNGIIYEIDDDQTISLAPVLSILRPGFTLEYSGDIDIPATISIGGNTYTVTGIKQWAFSQRDYGITGVHLPKTISYIEENPFDHCSSLQSLSVDYSNPYYDHGFGNAIIEKDTNKLIAGCGNTHIPNYVETIGSCAFYNRPGLRTISIPESVTTIEGGAFGECYELMNIFCMGQTPPSATGAFSADPCYYQTTLYVPGEAIENYYSDEVWGQFQNIQGLYQPRVTFDERGDELTITVIGLGNLEVYVDGRHAGTGDCILTYKVQRQNSNDFHVSVNVIQHYNGHSNGFYYGYDSRYDSFTTLPILYASEVEQGQGLKINMISDANDYYNNYFWNDGFDYVWPEYCYYRINGTGPWTRGEIDDLFYLPEYGDYTIEAYACAGGDRCANSSTISIDVHYGSDGFYSRYISYLNTHIVYNGLYYFNSDDENNVTVSLSQTDSYGVMLPTLSDIVIPASFTIAGDEYTVTHVSRSDCTGVNSITCLSATPIDGYLGEDSDPFFETPLFVPQEGLEAYKTHEQWGKFLNIVPFIGAGPGDINGDGSIAISDVTNLIDMLLGGDELPAWADVDGDGIVGIKDVTILIDRLLGS